VSPIPSTRPSVKKSLGVVLEDGVFAVFVVSGPKTASEMGRLIEIDIYEEAGIH
jgi:hypothetical protein